RRLFESRLPLYRNVADFEVQVAGRDIEEIVTDIMKQTAL
ncbi:MAG: shikimate kinase, partial [Desulfocapsa sp.]